MNTSDYKKKNLLSDKVYKKFDEDSTNIIAQNTKILVEKTTFPIKSILRPTYSLPSRLYGLPKIHKPNISLRSIVNAIHFPTYNLSCFLT